MCCGNGKEMSYRYYVPTVGNQIPSGTNDTSTSKLKVPDASLYEQELANFVSKSKDGKGIAVLKKRQLKIDTAFMSKKPKQQHRLGSYPVIAKYHTSCKETSHKSNSQCEQDVRIASLLKRMKAEMSKPDEHVIKVYKSGTINLAQINVELNSVKELCNGLNKYYDDVKEMVKQVEEAVNNANNAKTKVNVATQKFKCPYKWKCNTCNL